MLSIRKYQPNDADATIEIFLKAIREVASKDYTPGQVDAWAQVEDPEAWAKARESRPTWIATCNGSPAGFADLEPGGHLDMMFVHPHYQRLGAASLLMGTIEAVAHSYSLQVISTEASLTARPFFESRGFHVVAAQEVQKRGRMLPNFRMEKYLSGDR